MKIKCKECNRNFKSEEFSLIRTRKKRYGFPVYKWDRICDGCKNSNENNFMKESKKR